jgi:acyl-CoA thioester hydrolase
MGHFTVRRYAAAFDDASYQLLSAISGEPPVTPDARYGWADVKQVYQYHAEMRAGDLYAVTGKPVRLGTSSITLAYEMRLRSTGDLVAEMEARLVRFDLAARKSAPIAGALRARIEALLDPSAA